MRTPIEALKEIRDRLTYFCLRTDGKYDPPWATELVGIIDEAVTDSHAFGNAAAMREALVCLRDAARNFYHQILNSKYSVILDKYTCCKQGFPAVLDLRYAIPKANFAISKPPRNCDVGSLAEQRQRFLAYCEKMQNTDKACCGGCPIVKLRMDGTIGTSCELAWAQMPHAAQEGGAK